MMAQNWYSSVEAEMSSADDNVVKEISLAYPELYKMCSSTLESNQHRIRSAISMLTYHALGGTDKGTAVSLGMSLEPVIIGLETHDRIDGDGKVIDSRKKLFSKGSSTTKVIVSGDYMYIVGIRNAYNYAPKVVKYIIKASSVRANAIFAIQDNLKNSSVTEDECKRLVRSLVAVDFLTLMESAADLADADQATIERMGECGSYIGMAVKVQEDLLDLVGTGKDRPAMQAFVEGRVSLPIVYSIQGSGQVREAFAKADLTQKEAQALLPLIRSTDCESRCKEFIAECMSKARSIIEGLKESEYKDALLSYIGSKDLLA